jgi:hypothetical protein
MKCLVFSGVVHWSGSRAGLNDRDVYLSYFKLLLVVGGT